MLFTKCIYAPIEASDGLRVSVMSRHTLSDGLTPDPRILASSYAEWRAELAPLPSLVGRHYRDEISWHDFRTEYEAFLKRKSVEDYVRKLADEAMTTDITLLCVEEDPLKCHRSILAERCKIYRPSLVITHLFNQL